MKITIIYDNEAKMEGVEADWGFSCLVEDQKTPNVLFDTGTSSSILIRNMRKLGVKTGSIGIVVISHPHLDHVGGLQGILHANRNVELYIPRSYAGEPSARKVTRVKGPLEIRENIFTTGELGGIEQTLAVRTNRGIFVVAGCSHPGVGKILDAASRFGEIYGIAGGFHGFNDFKRLNPLSLICPCHCTQYKKEIKRIFKDKCLDCGAGVVIKL